MEVALRRHDKLMRSAIAARRGTVFKTVGDVRRRFIKVIDDPQGAADLINERVDSKLNASDIDEIKPLIKNHLGAMNETVAEAFKHETIDLVFGDEET